jgi:hypothetical protein
MKNEKPYNPSNSTRPMLATTGNLDIIKLKFAQSQVEETVKAQPGSILPRAEESVSNFKFFPFPQSGNVLSWMLHPVKGTHIVVVNVEPDITKEPLVSVIAVCQQREAAQMLCDGVNFLYRVQQETIKATEAAAVISTKVDSTPESGV